MAGLLTSQVLSKKMVSARCKNRRDNTHVITIDGNDDTIAQSKWRSANALS